MKKLFKVFLFAIASVVAGTVASAQVTTASLGGRIVDTKGETIIGVAVIATHTPSGTVYGAVTNADGRYTMNGLRAGGPYTIEISSLGYQGQVYNDITLQLGEQFTLDARLADDTRQVGSRNQREKNRENAVRNVVSRILACAQRPVRASPAVGT